MFPKGGPEHQNRLIVGRNINEDVDDDDLWLKKLAYPVPGGNRYRNLALLVGVGSQI
jgi:hypothetical protein